MSSRRNPHDIIFDALRARPVIRWTSWDTEYNDHDGIARHAGSAIDVRDEMGHSLISFTVPTERIANNLALVLTEMLEVQTADVLLQLSHHIATIALKAARMEEQR